MTDQAEDLDRVREDTGSSSRTLFVGPNIEQLTTAAFDAAARVAGDQPGSVLYVSQQGADLERAREQWRATRPAVQLQTETFDGIINTADERTTYFGPSTHITELERSRIAEAAVERLDADHPLAPSGVPGSGLCTQVADLHSLLSFAGMQTPTDVTDRLRALADGDPTLRARAAELASLIDTYQTVEAEWRAATDRPNASYRSDRYDRVLENDAIATTFDHVDAVVLGPATVLSWFERQLLARLADTYPTTAVLPRVTRDTPTGVDRAVGSVRAFYLAHDFSERAVGQGADATVPARGRAAAALFSGTGTVVDNGGDTADDTPLLPDLDRRVYETTTTEVRAVARALRADLADGRDPETIGVFLPDTTAYLSPLVGACATYDVPVTWETEHDLGETATGQLVADLCTLARDDATIETVARVVTNPVVTPASLAPDCDPTVVVDHAEQLESTRPAALVAALEQTAAQADTPEQAHTYRQTATAVETILEAGTPLQGALTAVDDGLATAFQQLGVDASDPLPDASPIDAAVERRAADRLTEIAASLAAAAPLYHAEADASTVDQLARAVAAPTISVSAGRDADCVRLVPLLEAPHQQFDRSYVVGLTDQHMPRRAERLAYTRPINEAAPYLERSDPKATARHALGTLIARDGELVLTRPTETADGEPTVAAATLQAFERVLDLDTPTVTAERDAPAGSVEDLLRETAVGLAASDDTTPVATTAVETVADLGPEGAATHLDAGIEAASARAHPTVGGDEGRFYGRVDAELVDALHDDERVFSPSALDTYATCGFRYYLGRVLDVDEPDETTLDPDALDRGTYLHAVLERFGRSCQDEGLDLPAADTPAYRERLVDAAVAALDELDGHETAFGTGWLQRVLAGLPADRVPVDPPDYDGLLVRFLQADADYSSRTAATPTLFEAAIGTGHDGDEVSAEPARIGPHDVAVRGDVDRVDHVSREDGPGAVVHDYKASVGSRYSERKITDGLRFQLPTYLLMLDETTSATPLAAGYYETDVDGDVAAFATGIGDLTASTPTDELDALLDLTTDRIDRMATAVDAGAFQPAFVGANEAGCRYCGFRDVCDIRHHRGQDVIESAQRDGDPYVPQAVRGGDDD